LICSTWWPRSSINVFNPFSHNSFAAHPPEIPEPTTIASKVYESGMWQDCELRIADYMVLVLKIVIDIQDIIFYQLVIRNPQSVIRNPQSVIRN
jgi:hypothetical protein